MFRDRRSPSAIAARPPLVASEMLHQITVTEGEMTTVVCPDCHTWRVVRKGAVTPHGVVDRTIRPRKRQPEDTGKKPCRADVGEKRCPGSNRPVVIDISPDAWYQRLSEGLESTRGVTVPKFHVRPKPGAVPAITQLDPAPATADSARRTYLTHRARCATCVDAKHCQDGKRLGADYLRLLRREPEQRRNRALYEEVHAAGERARTRQLPNRRAAEWDRVEAAVKAADTERALIPVGIAVVSPIKGAGLPSGTPELPWERKKKQD